MDTLSKQKRFRIAVIGFGNRGSQYADLLTRSGRAEIAAAVDDSETALRLAGRFGVPENRRFADAEAFFGSGLAADGVVIATADRAHFAQTSAAVEAGLPVLLEKPFGATEDECEKLVALEKEKGGRIMVCHVLRYSLFYTAVMRLIRDGAVGDPVGFSLTEDVGYWQAAHSYVRGAWANSSRSAPMILAKSCHDLDLLYMLSGRKCLSVQSFGRLGFFDAAHAPAGAGDCCLSCPAAKDCPFDAMKIYTAHPSYLYGNRFADCRAADARARLETLPRLTRCVFGCDNDAVDRQTLNMELEGGVTAQFAMHSLSCENERTITVHGTRGQLWGAFGAGRITVRAFGSPPETLDLAAESQKAGCHGGGDKLLIDDFLDMLEGKTNPCRATLEQAAESHRVAFAAEKSRLNNGRTIRLK